MRSSKKHLVPSAVSVLYLYTLNELMKIVVDENYYDHVFDVVPVNSLLNLVETS